MTRLIAIFLSALLALSCTAQRSLRGEPTGIQTAEPLQAQVSDTLSQAISRILDDSMFSHDFLGVMVVSLPDGALLYERNSSKLFHPASNLKLFTTATALNLLDPGFQCTTRVFASGPVVDGLLQGDLTVRGSGDPMIETDDLDTLAARLRASGIRIIAGDIVGDTSYFDDQRWGRGWMWDDEPDADEAFFSPLTLNANAVDIVVEPGRSAGKRPGVALRPPTSYLSVENVAVTSRDTTLPPLKVTRTHGTNALLVTGHLAPGAAARTFHLSVDQPESYFLHLLRERLSKHGIEVRGASRFARAPAVPPTLVISHPLDTVLHQINKISDNIAAENLLKILGAEKIGTPGTSEKGLTLVRRYVGDLGVDTTTAVIADASGVSAYTIVTPEMIIRLLRHEYDRSSTFGRFYESLPIAGRDGSLRSRMGGTAADSNAHAKTGSLAGVSSLSGYVTSADGVLLAFSILANHHPGEIAVLRQMQDRIVELLASSRAGRK
jgi:D-alanyl-D-alanine carboxypeptidase/D-alanyl-D-alanine-endopeptidase (penicillin-binding protein 4)